VALAGLTVMMFAPAVLVLVGTRGTWWTPKWAQRVVPHIDIEGTTLDRTDTPAVATATASADRPPQRPGNDSMKL
jgi:RND superfamily putative drug exporter